MISLFNKKAYGYEGARKPFFCWGNKGSSGLFLRQSEGLSELGELGGLFSPAKTAKTAKWRGLANLASLAGYFSPAKIAKAAKWRGIGTLLKCRDIGIPNRETLTPACRG